MKKISFNKKILETRLVERIYTYCSFLPLLGVIFLYTGVFDLFLPRDGVWIIFTVFPILSSMFFIWGLGLVIQAWQRETICRILMVATLTSGSYAYVVFAKLL